MDGKGFANPFRLPYCLLAFLLGRFACLRELCLSPGRVVTRYRSSGKYVSHLSKAPYYPAGRAWM